MFDSPSIFKVPDVATKSVTSYQNGCSFYDGRKMQYCSAYNGKCIDTKYDSRDVEGGLGQALTIGGGVVTVIGIIVTVASMT